MRHVVLDTNNIYPDFQMDHGIFKVLFDGVRLAGDKIYIPEVVFLELLNKFEENLREHIQKANKEIRSVNKLTGNNNQYFNDDYILSSVENYKRVLSRIIDDHEIEIIKLPIVQHEQLLNRCLKRKKPFSPNGKGYQDALIWESVLDLAELTQQDVILLTKNTEDFWEKDGLHRDLIADVAKRKIRENQVKVVIDIKTLTDQYYMQLLNKVADLQMNLVAFGEQISEELFAEDFSSADLNAPTEFDDMTFLGFEDIYETKINDNRLLSSGELFIQAEIFGTATFGSYIFKSDYYTLSDDDLKKIYIQDSDWNDHVMSIGIEKIITLELGVIYDLENKEIKSIEVESVYSDAW
ncbi:DUF4935 domain-containing protein [Brevibacillus brevis X23]|nr:DUF4935 domain-containing protein [Brevibacillus brevis X23]